MKKNFIDKLHEKIALPSLTPMETKEDILKCQAFIASFPETEDCYELAYYRYQCRMYYFSFPKKLLLNILGFGAFIVSFFFVFFSNKKLKKKQNKVAVLERARDIPNYEDIVPNQIFSEFEKVLVIDNHNEKFGFLCKEAKKYYFENIKRHPFNFFFNYFVYNELVTHSSILLQQNPESTFVYINERNVASPILTELYRTQNRNINTFLHGELPFQLFCAFMQFSKFYVWDKSYINMLSLDLRCHVDEYIVYTPKKLEKKWDFRGIIPEYFCSYYFSGEDEQTIYNIVSTLVKLSEAGLKCKVRPHPRNELHKKLLTNLLSDKCIKIEEASEISLEKSLAETDYVIGLQSTVLSEALVEGKKIVIDDVSNYEYFETLRMQKFNIFNKPHLLLSDLLRKNTPVAIQTP